MDFSERDLSTAAGGYGIGEKSRRKRKSEIKGGKKRRKEMTEKRGQKKEEKRWQKRESGKDKSEKKGELPAG